MPALELTEGLLGIHTKREFYGFDYTELASLGSEISQPIKLEF
jgi:hypothetical protein